MTQFTNAGANTLNGYSREKQAVALTSIGAAVLLTALKSTVGIYTGSLGILSEAMHSGLDLVAAAITYLSVRVSDKPADADHPFGHGKIEHLSAFIETGLLVVTCGWIVWEAVRRLFIRGVHVEPSLWAFGVMFISITIDSFRSRALFRVARKYNSQALEADALHFSTDVYSSTVVILGLILVYASQQRHLHWLEDADPVAALLVAGIVVYITFRLGKRTVDALVDAAPTGTSTLIAESVSRVSGVLSLDRIRTRESGSRLFVDLRLTLADNISLEHAKSVADVVEGEVHRLFPTADVVIHTTPKEPSSGDVVAKIRAVAHRQNFLVHEVSAYEVNGRINVHLDLEVDPQLRLAEAHDQSTQLESEIKANLPEVNEVNVHLEPLPVAVESGNEARIDHLAVEHKLEELARDTAGVLDCHSVEVHQVGGNVVVRIQCTFEPDLPIAKVHVITEILEFKCRQAFPQISKITIHAEPLGRA
ncbi:MAG: cation diffusion facilitator family transporter [Terriglobia bacterium]|jgi:cation diffusion facilitator family transporter